MTISVNFLRILYIISIIFIILYALEYTKVRNDFIIDQLSIDQLTYEQYMERYPTIIENGTISKMKTKASFGYSYTYSYDTIKYGEPVSILSRYAIIENTNSSPLYVQIFHPNTYISKNIRKNPNITGKYATSAKGTQNHLTQGYVGSGSPEQGMVVILYTNMKLLLPHKWSIVMSDNIDIVHLCDIIGTGLMNVQQGLTSVAYSSAY